MKKHDLLLARSLSSALVVVAAVVAVVGCGEPASGAGDAPPLFNAIDPSVQCPAGQVGWDFSTGGVDDVKRNFAATAITITEASFGGACEAGLEQTFRSTCEGEQVCTLPVACGASDFTLKYACGTEPHIYQAQLEAGAGGPEVSLVCGLPLTIVKATYAPTASQPADITAALAATCSGKRRCANGVSGFQLNGYRDPQPNVAKRVQVRYVCGGEATEFVKDVEDFRLDVYCGTEERFLDFRETLRVVSVKTRLQITDAGAKAQVDAYMERELEKLSLACDGRINCAVTPGRPPESYYSAPLLRREGVLDPLFMPETASNNGFFVEYVCGDATSPDIHVMNVARVTAEPVELNCGQEITVLRTSETRTGFTEAVQRNCNGRRTCRAPTRGGTQYWEPPGGARVEIGQGAGARRVTYTYTCGNLLNAFEYTSTIDHGSANKKYFECPPFDREVFKGIRVARVTPEDQTLAVTKRCFGRDRCDAAGATVQFRCGNSPTLQTSTSNVSCETPITLVGVSGCSRVRQPPPGWCQDQPGRCDYYPGYTTDALNLCESLTVSYTCGTDPAIKTTTAQRNGAPGGPSPIALTCPTLANPYIQKSCVSNICYGNQRRDEKLNCVQDSTLQPTVSVQQPVINNWQPLGDGSTSRWGAGPVAPENGVTVLRSNIPYQVYSVVYYQTDSRQRLPDDTSATVWAYDEFERIDGAATPQPVFGFRCLMGDAALQDSSYPSQVAGFEAAATGGKRGVIPQVCLDQDGFNDETTSWYDAAKALNVSESSFRAQFRRRTTWMVSALDAAGVHSVRRFGNTSVAVNPLGFFYDPRRDWVNKLGYYAQRTDFARRQAVRFEMSTEIELSSVDQQVSATELLVDVEDPALLPRFEVDFRWYLRGDAPSNPYSPTSRVAGNPAGVSLRDRQLTATVEIARQDPGLSNPWIASNAVRFTAQPIEGADPFIKSDRLLVEFTPDVRRRLLSVRSSGANVPGAVADGFMSDATDEDSVFLVRTCMDMNGLQRAPGETNIDNKTFERLAGHTMRVSRRCSEPTTIVVRRQLFVRPTLPAEARESDSESGAMTGSGDRDVGGGNDNGSQGSCRRQCTVAADCGAGGSCEADGFCARSPQTDRCTSDNRTQMGLSGQFPITIFAVRSATATTDRGGSVTSRAEMFGFQTFLPETREQTAQNPNAFEIELTISPNLQPIINAWKGKKLGVINTDAKKVIMKRRRVGAGASAGTAERDGLGLALSKEFFLTIGPVPLVLDIGFSQGLGFGVTVKLSGEQASVGQQSSFYPCLNSNGTRCFVAETQLRTFDDAYATCQEKGGRLAAVRNATDLAEVERALATANIPTANAVWVGAQAAYLYGYPPCQTNGGIGPNGERGQNGQMSAACRENATTGYFWIEGGQRFAAQRGVAPALTANTTTEHGFSALSFAASPIPAKAAVAFVRSTRAASVQPTSTTYAAVCEYDPATTVLQGSSSISFGVEISMGFSAALCVPSSKIGVCLTANLNIFSTALSFETGRNQTSVFRGASPRLRNIYGGSYQTASWKVAFLSGGINLEFRFLFWNKGITLKSFSWGPSYEQVLYYLPTSYFKELP